MEARSLSSSTGGGSEAAHADAPFLDCRSIEKRFGGASVLEGVDLRVGRGELVTLLGPSGCGKTTLLRIISGLANADRGEVRIGGVDLTGVPPHRRNIGVVFQSYALFPHLSVAQNVAFGLKARRFPAARVAAGVEAALRRVQLSEMADRGIGALSGGQQQRVAVARALALEPQLLLLDEPFSALDRKLREGMQIELRRLLRELGITGVFVTHDQDEAFVMSDRVALMNEGRIEQFAPPGEIYRRPVSVFALGFVGQSVMLTGTVSSASGGIVRIETGVGPVQAQASFLPGSPVIVGVRPEMLRPERPGTSADGPLNSINARLIDRVHLGSKQHLLFSAPTGERLLCEINSADADGQGPGSELVLQWPVGETLVFPAPPAWRERRAA